MINMFYKFEISTHSMSNERFMDQILKLLLAKWTDRFLAWLIDFIIISSYIYNNNFFVIWDNIL